MHKLSGFIAGLVCCLLLGGAAQAQVSYNYTYSASVGNPGGLNTETDFDQTGWSTLMAGGMLSNTWSSTLSIPFTFEYFGQNVTQLKASANGLITFSVAATALPNDNEILPASSLPTNTIACWWDAFSTSPPTGTNDQVQYKVFGTAPNRQLWVRWYSFEWGGTSFVYVATVLEEGSNKIYLVDQYGSLTSSWVTSTVGLQRNLAWNVMAAGDEEPLSGAGSAYTDNSFYEFTPYTIPPQDLRPVRIEAPAVAACGMGMEPVSVTIVNQGQLPAAGVTAQFSVDGGPATSPESVISSLNAGDTITYTFSQLANLATVGAHSVQVWVNSNGDGNVANDSLTLDTEHVLLVNQLPYREEFESGPAGWVSGGSNNSWELGIPANVRIQGASSGQQAWVTGRTVPHNSFEQSWVVSPCFNLSNASADTWIGFYAWWESEAGWDGANVQASTDGGLSWNLVGDLSSPDWYNYPNIGSQPGGYTQGWSGMFQTNNGSNGYRWLTHKLDNSLIGQGSVRFRIMFGSGGAQNADGFAFDDFTLGTPPTVNLGLNGYRCEGTVLHANSGGGTVFEWSDGSTGPSLALTNTTGSPIIDSVISVRVFNALGLSRRDTLTFSMTLPIELAVVSTDSARCAGEASGSLNLSVAGGLPPYSYTWDQGMSTQNPTDLSAGTYSGLMRDANGCQQALPEVLIEEPLPLTHETLISDAQCYGDSNGHLTISPAGGNGGYSLSWNTGDSSLTLSDLGAGMYTYELRDRKNCQLVDSARIGQPDSLILAGFTATDANCIDSEDGMIGLEIMGGTPPYSYQWDHGANGDTASGLAPGTYRAVVQDSFGCLFTTDTFRLAYSDTIPEADFGFNIVGGMVQFRDSSDGGQSFMWDFGNGAVSDKRNPNYFYPENGTYTVKLIVSNACGTDTSTQIVSLETVSINQLAADALSLTPNPSVGTLRLSVGSENLGAATVVMYQMNGQRLFQIDHPGLRAASFLPLHFPDEAPDGMYFVQVLSEQGQRTFKIRLQR